MQAGGLDGPGQLADDVAPGAHFRRAPVGKAAVVHRESVVVFGHGHDIAGPGRLEQRGPFPGVEFLGLEKRDEVLVAEFGLRPIGLQVVFVLGRILDIHLARIPFAAEGGDGIDAPVDEDAELGVEIPFRDFLRFQ